MGIKKQQTLFAKCTNSHLQLRSKLFNPPYGFPMISIVNKSCNIESCVNNMLHIIQNMMVSQCSELELSTLSGQPPLS